MISLLQSLIFLCSVPFAHDYHWSNCTIEHNIHDETLQISIHLFIDDLEEALRRQGADDLFICTTKEAEGAETYVFRYLQQKFKLDVNGKSVELEWIGKEITDDLSGVWCYLLVSDIQQLEQLDLAYTVLMEIYEDQKNVLEVIQPKRSKGYFIFSRSNSFEQFTF